MHFLSMELNNLTDIIDQAIDHKQEVSLLLTMMKRAVEDNGEAGPS